MCKVEAVINRRPFTRCSDNTNDLNVISPNSLLTMKGSTMLPHGPSTTRTFTQRSDGTDAVLGGPLQVGARVPNFSKMSTKVAAAKS